MLVGLFSSGFLAKILAGAVALAAVGGVAVTVPRATPEAQTGTAVVAPAFVEAASPVAPSTTEATEETALPAEVLVQRALDYAQEMQRWGDCVSAVARSHSGGTLDFAAVCGETPAASDHGLGKENAPGQTKTTDNNGLGKENAPGQTKTTDNDGLGKENAPGQTKTTDDPAEARSVDKPDKPEKALGQGED